MRTSHPDSANGATYQPDELAGAPHTSLAAYVSTDESTKLHPSSPRSVDLNAVRDAAALLLLLVQPLMVVVSEELEP